MAAVAVEVTAVAAMLWLLVVLAQAAMAARPKTVPLAARAVLLLTPVVLVGLAPMALAAVAAVNPPHTPASLVEPEETVARVSSGIVLMDRAAVVEQRVLVRPQQRLVLVASMVEVADRLAIP